MLDHSMSVILLMYMCLLLPPSHTISTVLSSTFQLKVVNELISVKVYSVSLFPLQFHQSMPTLLDPPTEQLLSLRLMAL